MDRLTLASFIDHTLLAPTVDGALVAAACALAARERVASLCVSPARVLRAVIELDGTGVPVASVVGFPSGAHRVEVKTFEAYSALTDGAQEIDVVIDLGNVFDGEWRRVGAELCSLRDTTMGATLKVILETAALNEDQIVELCRIAVAEGVDMVKTSTGFHPAGGATVEVVRLMSETVAGACGVKASGGIRTTQEALAMLGAGATRLGCSATVAILDALSTNSHVDGGR